MASEIILELECNMKSADRLELSTSTIPTSDCLYIQTTEAGEDGPMVEMTRESSLELARAILEYHGEEG